MADQKGRIIKPLSNTDEEIQAVPWPRGVRPGIPEASAVREINFGEGIAFSGPSRSDLPAIPKPIVKPRTIPSQADMPALEAVGIEGNLSYIAKLLSSVLLQPESFVTSQMTCQVANRGYQLPDIVIPPLRRVVIKAWFTNVGVIYLAHRQSDSQAVAVAWPLIANEGVGIETPNVNDIWVMATVANEGVNILVEQL